MTQQGQGRQPARRFGPVIASVVGCAALISFIIQNRADIKVHFLFWGFIWPLWIYTIVIALFGALVWFALGVARRHRRRRQRRSA